jgi:hypothetical protein
VAESGLSGPILNRSARRILEAWLEQLGATLPARGRLRTRIVDELRDGLHSAAEHHLEAGNDPVRAAQAAVAEIGDADVVAASFRGELTAHLARRVGLVLLASGPLVGAVWLAALVPPLWPPRPADLLSAHPLYLAVLATAIPAALLAVAATGPLGRSLPLRPMHVPCLAAVAATACAAGDGLLLAALVFGALSATQVLAWQTALLAVAVSMARLAFATWAARRCLTAGSIRFAARH